MDRDTVENLVRRKDYASLLRKDQCKIEMAAGNIFQGLQEGNIDFPPTYKFDKNTTDVMSYDSSEKRRVPAYTDRIFFRGSTLFKPGESLPEDIARN